MTGTCSRSPRPHHSPRTPCAGMPPAPDPPPRPGGVGNDPAASSRSCAVQMAPARRGRGDEVGPPQIRDPVPRRLVVHDRVQPHAPELLVGEVDCVVAGLAPDFVEAAVADVAQTDSAGLIEVEIPAAEEVVAAAPEDAVVAVASEDVVVVRAAVNPVVASAAIDDVVAGFAVEGVVAGFAQEGVVTGSAVRDVVTRAGIDQIVAVAAGEIVVAVAPVEGVDAADLGRRAVEGAEEDVVAILADEDIVAVLSHEPVVAVAAGEVVVAVAAVEGVDAADLGRRAVEGAEEDVVAILADEDIIAVLADEPVVAVAAGEVVVAVAAVEDVDAGTTEQQIVAAHAEGREVHPGGVDEGVVAVAAPEVDLVAADVGEGEELTLAVLGDPHGAGAVGDAHRVRGFRPIDVQHAAGKDGRDHPPREPIELRDGAAGPSSLAARSCHGHAQDSPDPIAQVLQHDSLLCWLRPGPGPGRAAGLPAHGLGGGRRGASRRSTTIALFTGAHRRPGRIWISSHFYELLRALVARSSARLGRLLADRRGRGGRRDRYPHPGRG